MSDYIIATSSTSDLTRDYLDAHSIPFVSYSYTIGDKLYEDDCREESRDAVYKGMRNNGDLLKTSMINEYIYCDFFNSPSLSAIRKTSMKQRCQYKKAQNQPVPKPSKNLTVR